MDKPVRRETLTERIMESIDAQGGDRMVIKNVSSAAASSFSGDVPFWLSDLDKVATPDQSDPAEGPILVAELDQARIKLTRRTAAMPYVRRNIEADEIYFIHRGAGRIETELGSIDAPTSRTLFIGRGVSHRVIPEGGDFMALIVECEAAIKPHKSVKLAEVPLIMPDLAGISPDENDTGTYEERIISNAWTANLIREYDPIRTAEALGDSNFVYGVDMADIPAHSPVAPMPGLPFLLFESPVMVWAISKRTDPLPFYHRNIDLNEVEFVHQGVGDQDTELGYLTAPTGSFYNLPRGIGHTPINRTKPMVAHIWETSGHVEVNPAILD